MAWLSTEIVNQTLGDTGLGPIAAAALVGLPAYFNGHAALTLLGGLIEQGVSFKAKTAAIGVAAANWWFVPPCRHAHAEYWTTALAHLE